MKSQIIEEVKSAVKNWWLSLVLGVLFIAVGFLLLLNPAESYMMLSIVFAVCMFAAGIFEITFATANRFTLSGWGWYLACGIIDLLLGLFLMLYPGVAATILPFVLAVWLLFRGFSSIGFSIDLNSFGVKNWGWYLVLGILAVVCSFAIIWYPLAGAFSVVYIVSFGFLFLGIFRIMLAFVLRDLHKHGEKLKETLNELNKE